MPLASTRASVGLKPVSPTRTMVRRSGPGPLGAPPAPIDAVMSVLAQAPARVALWSRRPVGKSARIAAAIARALSQRRAMVGPPSNHGAVRSYANARKSIEAEIVVAGKVDHGPLG